MLIPSLDHHGGSGLHNRHLIGVRLGVLVNFVLQAIWLDERQTQLRYVPVPMANRDRPLPMVIGALKSCAASWSEGKFGAFCAQGPTDRPRIGFDSNREGVIMTDSACSIG